MRRIRPWFSSFSADSSQGTRGHVQSNSKTYFATLDGWRALSVIAVILFHGRFGFFSDDSFMWRIAAHGEIGVEVFFAISGFLISSLLLQEFHRTGRISIHGFYLRRFFRIVPAYYLVVAVIATLGILKIIPLNSGDLPSCVFFYRNYRPLGMGPLGGFYTAHFWSLAIEEHFYILWPTLLLLVKPRRIGVVAAAIALAVNFWREFEIHRYARADLFTQQSLLAHTDMRIDSLLWACVAAIYFPELKKFFDRIPFNEVWLFFAGVVIATIAFHIPGSFFILAVTLPLLVLSTVLKPKGIFGRILDSLPLRWIGTLSYSIYLWQELFLPEDSSMKAHGVLGYFQQGPWNLITILACACLTYYLLERPMNRLGHALSASSQRPLPGPRVIGESLALASSE